MLEQLAGMEEAFSFSLGLEVEQVADCTHFAVQRLQGRVVFEEFLEAFFLLVGEPVGTGAEELEEGAVIADPGEFSGQSGKVLHDDAYGVETVGHEDGVGEPFAYQIAVGVGEVDADHLHLVTALEAFQIADHLAGAAGTRVFSRIIFMKMGAQC